MKKKGNRSFATRENIGPTRTGCKFRQCLVATFSVPGRVVAVMAQAPAPKPIAVLIAPYLVAQAFLPVTTIAPTGLSPQHGLPMGCGCGASFLRGRIPKLTLRLQNFNPAY